MAVTATQRDLKGTVGRVTRIKVIFTYGAGGSDTGVAYTFSRAFKGVPELIGIVRNDAIASVITGRISALSATAITLLSAASTGSEVIEVTLEGELA